MKKPGSGFNKSDFNSAVFWLEVKNLKWLFRTETFSLYIIQTLFAVILLGLAILLFALWR